MTYIYLAITLYVLVLVVMNLIEEKKISYQINAALVIIPLILRLFMIK